MQTKTTQTMTNLTNGQRFFYTGDGANLSTFGTIVEVISVSHSSFTSSGYSVIYDKKRFEGDSRKGYISINSFVPGIGCRFVTLEDYNKKRIESFKKYGIKESEIVLAK